MLLIKLHRFIYVDYDLAAVLHDRILENPVLVFLGGVESYAKELAYPFETIYIFVCSGWLLLLGSFGLSDDFFQLSYRHHCQRCVISDYHITLFEIIWSVMCTFPNRWQV